MKKFLIIVFLVILVAAVINGVHSDLNKQSEDVAQENKTVISPTPVLNYEIVEKIEDKNDENMSVLISPGETNVEAIALEVKKTCKKSCNISIFDDKEALKLDSEYSKLSSSEAMTEWKKKNYVFVAEHLVAMVGYGDSENWGFGPYSEYPMKDWYYKELKGE